MILRRYHILPKKVLSMNVYLCFVLVLLDLFRECGCGWEYLLVFDRKSNISLMLTLFMELDFHRFSIVCLSIQLPVYRSNGSL